MARNRDKGCYQNPDFPPNYEGTVITPWTIRRPHGEGERQQKVSGGNTVGGWSNWGDAEIYDSICDKMNQGKTYTIGQLCINYGVEIEDLIHILKVGNRSEKV